VVSLSQNGQAHDQKKISRLLQLGFANIAESRQQGCGEPALSVPFC
jgi:hypothetical protein